LRVLFVASNSDPASLNIAENIIKEFQLIERDDETEFKVFERGEFKLLYINEESIFLDRLKIDYDADLLIVLSKHLSSEGLTLSTAKAGRFLLLRLSSVCGSLPF